MGQWDPLIAKVRTAHILKFLVKNGISTVRQITNYLGNITENAVYRFLITLAHKGLVVDCGSLTGGGYGKGKPKRLWKAAQVPEVKELVAFLESV